MWIVLVIILIVAIAIYGTKKRDQNKNLKSSISSQSIADAQKIMQDAFLEAYGDVNMEQKIASTHLLWFFAGSCNGSAGQINKINDIIASYCGNFGISSKMFKESLNQYHDIEETTNVLSSVNNRNFLDQLLYSCFCIISINKPEHGGLMFTKIFEKFGYSDEDCAQVIEKIILLGKQFNT